WLNGRDRRALLDLAGRNVAGEQAAVAAVTALAVRERHVAGLVRRERKRETAQRGLHRIDGRGLNIDRDSAELARARNPGVEPLQAAHDFVTRAVDLGVARRSHARGGTRLRREFGFGILPPARRALARLARRAGVHGDGQRKRRLLRGFRL